MTIRMWLIIGAILLALGAGYAVYKSVYNSGRESVTSELNSQNAELNEAVANVNGEITVRVQAEDATIRVQSQEIQEIIDASPEESLTNITRIRLERVQLQQQSVSETGSNPE